MKHVETGTRRIRILVTGFGAFPGAPSNPSAKILGRLSRHRARLERLGIAIETCLLPVVYDQVGGAIEKAARDRPDAILHLGLAGRRRAVSVETRAVNRAGPLHPDAARRRTAQAIVPGGPPMLRSRYPAARIVAAIRAQGVAVAPSIDAGDYVCNTTLYLTLLNRWAPLAGFLHVPRTSNPTRPRHRMRRQRPSLDALAEAVVATALVMGQTARLSKTHLLD